jgi:serine/threonine protein kinase
MPTKSQWICDISAGLQALHSCDVVHNDIKCGNILLFKHKNGTHVAKVSDFGCSVPLALSVPTKRAAATRWFAAPEAYSDDCSVCPSRDLYAFGLAVFHIIAEQPPFIGYSEEDLWDCKRNDEVLKYVSGRLEDITTPLGVPWIIENTLRADPHDRRLNLTVVETKLSELKGSFPQVH